MYFNGKYVISNNDRVLMPFSVADTLNDNRVLIPFMTPSHKMGMMNHIGEVVIKPEYDKICNDVYRESDVIVVGKLHPYGFIKKNGGVDSRVDYRYGVIDIHGDVVLELGFRYIFLGLGCDRITVVSDSGFCVCDTKGNTIVPYGKYKYIDGFDKGLARVKNDDKQWGIINVNGEEVLPLVFNKIWNFYRKNRLSTYVESKERGGEDVYFHNLEPSIPYPPHYHKSYKRDVNDSNENYGQSYGEFAGSYAQDAMGYSDDVIYDAFEGDPDNYWNID